MTFCQFMTGCQGLLINLCFRAVLNIIFNIWLSGDGWGCEGVGGWSCKEKESFFFAFISGWTGLSWFECIIYRYKSGFFPIVTSHCIGFRFIACIVQRVYSGCWIRFYNVCNRSANETQFFKTGAGPSTGAGAFLWWRSLLKHPIYSNRHPNTPK